MDFTVFYAWQSDSPKKLNRYFVRDALEDAIQSIRGRPDIVESPRPEREEHADPCLDHDTKGIPGTPEIARTIFNKIDACGIFVADVTFVGRTDVIGESTTHKMLPNPNVLLELGYALARLGNERIICVMNEAFGKPTDLPFDLAHRRHPLVYNLSGAHDREAIKTQRSKLSDHLEGALRSIMRVAPLRNVDRGKRRILSAMIEDPADAVPRYAKASGANLPGNHSAEFIMCAGDLTARGIYLLLQEAGVDQLAQTADEESALLEIQHAYRDLKKISEEVQNYVFDRAHPKGTQIAMGYSATVTGVIIRLAVGFSSQDAIAWGSTGSFLRTESGCIAMYETIKQEEDFSKLMNVVEERVKACIVAVDRVRKISSLLRYL